MSLKQDLLLAKADALSVRNAFRSYHLGCGFAEGFHCATEFNGREAAGYRFRGDSGRIRGGNDYFRERPCALLRAHGYSMTFGGAYL